MENDYKISLFTFAYFLIFWNICVFIIFLDYLKVPLITFVILSLYFGLSFKTIIFPFLFIFILSIIIIVYLFTIGVYKYNKETKQCHMD